jgi:hypothetical protein
MTQAQKANHELTIIEKALVKFEKIRVSNFNDEYRLQNEVYNKAKSTIVKYNKLHKDTLYSYWDMGIFV